MVSLGFGGGMIAWSHYLFLAMGMEMGMDAQHT